MGLKGMVYDGVDWILPVENMIYFWVAVNSLQAGLRAKYF
jgi:hypothetical protein